LRAWIAGNQPCEVGRRLRRATMRGPRSCRAPWLAGRATRYGAANFSRRPSEAIGCQPDKRGGLATPDGSTVSPALAQQPRGVGIERDLNATGGAYRFKTSSETRGRPTRRGSAGLEADAHGRMFGEYAFMEDSCNASPELFCQRKRMNF